MICWCYLPDKRSVRLPSSPLSLRFYLSLSFFTCLASSCSRLVLSFCVACYFVVCFKASLLKPSNKLLRLAFYTHLFVRTEHRPNPLHPGSPHSLRGDASRFRLILRLSVCAMYFNRRNGA